MKSTRGLAGLTSEKPLTPSIVCPKRLSNTRHVYRLVLMPPTQLIARANRFWLIGIDSFVSNVPLRASGQSVRMLACSFSEQLEAMTGHHGSKVLPGKATSQGTVVAASHRPLCWTQSNCSVTICHKCRCLLGTRPYGCANGVEIEAR